MTADRPTASSSRLDHHHRYPPSKAASHLDHDPAATTGPDTISYIIHTDSNGINDLRLQVSEEASSSKHPLRPVYFRDRLLTEENEIVDNVVDTNTEKVCWSIHRPTRGWYLYLRSPVLPQGTAISIRSGAKDEADPSASPLTFSLNTKVRMQALERVRPRISHASEKSDSHRQQSELASTDMEEDVSSRSVATNDAEHAMQDVAVAVTGRENRNTASSGHTRRRSGATGSGTHSLDSRQTSKRSSTLTRSPMIPETDEDNGSPFKPTNGQSLSRLTIPSNPHSSGSSPPSTGDRPYSPTLSSITSFSPSSTARTSTFLLTNGRAPKQSPTAQSWARWAYSILPSEVRPSLSLDTDKSFSLYWSDSPSTSNIGAGESVEVARFQDQSGRWMWNSHTRGRLLLQTSAMQAVGLQKEFWISVALAYIQFLEDKDAYNAARDA